MSSWSRAATVVAARTADLLLNLGRALPLDQNSLGHPDPNAPSLGPVVTAISGKVNERGRTGMAALASRLADQEKSRASKVHSYILFLSEGTL